MALPQEIFEKLLIGLEKLCGVVNNDTISFTNFKTEIADLIEYADRYCLFDLELTDTFLQNLRSEGSDLESDQNHIAEELYRALAELIYSFERSNDSIKKLDYAIYLERARTNLTFDQVSKWKISNELSNEFSIQKLALVLNKSKLEIGTAEEYDIYKKKIKKTELLTLGNHKDLQIDKAIYQNIDHYFNHHIEQYRSHIEINYQQIKQEFIGCDAEIDIYIVPHQYNDGNILMQINFYKNFRKNDIRIYPYYVDLLYRFKNVEEIDARPLSSTISLFDELNPGESGNLFTVTRIQHELHRIFLSLAQVDEIRDYYFYLKRAKGYRIRSTDKNDEILINKNDRCFLFFQGVPNLEKLIELIDSDKEKKLVVFKSYPDEETMKYLAAKKVEVDILEGIGSEQINNENGELIHHFIKSRIGNLAISSNQNLFKGTDLIKRLRDCPVGQEGWVEYENICFDIIQFVFKNHFRSYTVRKQSYTHDGIFRRDLILNNNFCDSASFWSEMKTDFNCNLIVIDFKNYGDYLEQNEFYLPSKYLNLIIGKFGIVVSRKGLGKSAKILQRRMFQLDNTLLICLNDDDLIGMVNEKMQGQDSSYRLENQKFLLYNLD